MARTSSIKKQKSSPLIPRLSEATQAFLARRVVDTLAMVTFLFGVFLFISLLTYTHSDPSWNSAASNSINLNNDQPRVIDNVEIHNYMGARGAWSADILMQTIGFAAYIIPLICLIWGFKIYKRQSLSIFALRLISAFIACVTGAIALSLIPAGDSLTHPYLGSTAGTMLLSALMDTIKNVQIWPISLIGYNALCISSALLAIISTLYACAFTKHQIISVAKRLYILSLSLMLFTLNALVQFTNWIKHYNDPNFKGQDAKIFTWPNISLPRLNTGAVNTKPVAAEQKPAKKPAAQHAPATPAIPKDTPTHTHTTNTTIPVVAHTDPKTQTSKSESTQQRFALNEEGEWALPPLDLLEEVPEDAQIPQLDEKALRRNAELLQNVLNDFKIEGDIVSIHPGPVVTLYELEPAPGTKSSRIISLADDIARSMSAISVRCAVVPGRNVIGIELPNKERQFVYMRELLESRHYTKNKAHLPLILGKDIGGQPILADLAKMPHLLVAGTTGSGKSVAVNTMILSLLYALPPEKCRFIMIDPKMLELSVYDDIPHLLSPVVTEPGKAVVALKWTVAEMEERYRAMSKLGVRNIQGYNERLSEARKKGETIMHKVQTGFNPETGEAVYEDQEMDLTELPFIVVVVDEFADLMLVAGKDVENAIQRLAQMARAAGIHLIMATQRPSVDVITGVIKANFPTRISFSVTSKIDSRTILGEGGAEQLLGMGDMLYMAPGGRITRVHGPFVSDSDVEDVVNHLKAQAAPSYLTDITEGGDFGSTSEIMNAIFDDRSGSNKSGSDVDELYDQAVAIVARERKASTSFIQRHLQIGYNRAARIVEEMERQGVISAASPTGKREILISDFSEA